MSKVLVCDRCGRKLEHNKGCNISLGAYRYVIYKETWGGYDHEYDLCPNCEKAFDEFMKNKSEETEYEKWVRTRDDL